MSPALYRVLMSCINADRYTVSNRVYILYLNISFKKDFFQIKKIPSYAEPLFPANTRGFSSVKSSRNKTSDEKFLHYFFFPFFLVDFFLIRTFSPFIEGKLKGIGSTKLFGLEKNVSVIRIFFQNKSKKQIIPLDIIQCTIKIFKFSYLILQVAYIL